MYGPVRIEEMRVHILSIFDVIDPFTKYNHHLFLVERKALLYTWLADRDGPDVVCTLRSSCLYSHEAISSIITPSLGRTIILKTQKCQILLFKSPYQGSFASPSRQDLAEEPCSLFPFVPPRSSVAAEHHRCENRSSPHHCPFWRA